MGHIKLLLRSDLIDRTKTHLINDSLIQFKTLIAEYPCVILSRIVG